MKVASQRPGENLFPNLRKLYYICDWNEDNWPRLKILVTPTLHSLTLRLDSFYLDGTTIITNLPLTCPAIRNLIIESWGLQLPFCSDLICSWKDLHFVRVDACDARALTHLSLMRNLSELSISSLSLFTHDCFTFPTLRTLQLRSCDFDDCLEFMRGIGAACLTILNISLGKAHENVRWLFLFQVISERLKDSPLSQFFFCHTDCPSDHTTDDIRPLYIFPNVTTFEFNTCTLRKLDDDWIQEITVAWPNLTTLQLGPMTALTKVTVAGLAFLAQKCQNLSHLHMSIDGRIVGPLLEDGTCGLRPNVCMWSIALGHSPIADATEVARVLAHALPNLHHIDVGVDGDAGSGHDAGGTDIAVYAKRWKEVVALVREIREQEDGSATRSHQG
jgi:hypothetical protein